MPKRYFVYMVASKSRVLYTGVTNDLERRIYEHKMNPDWQDLSARWNDEIPRRAPPTAGARSG